METRKVAVVAVLLLVPAAQAQDLYANKTPENYTLSLEFDSSNVYIDDENRNTGTYTPGELEFPYIVSGQPAGIVSYGELEALTYQQSPDTFSVTQSSGGFLLPFTYGGYEAIEDDEDLVTSREFMDELEPSFGFPLPDLPTIKVLLEPDYEVDSFTGVKRGSVEIAVSNLGLENGSLLLEMEDVS